ncbi:MAG: J domain-containing protein [Acidobacteriota bacterium]|nr:J domain-containing protein [Acidobacteriota bacterium]
MKDHYAILGVARDAPPEVIRAAFRVLAQKYHPDRNTNPDAGRRAEEINSAYTVLKDPDMRAQYDQQLPPLAGVATGTFTENSERNPGSPHTFQSPAAPIRRTVGPTVYELLFQDGVVREHTEWIHYVQKVKHDARPFVGVGKHLANEAVAKQRLWLRLANGDQLIERSGDTLPVATGHPITLVSIYQPGLSKPAVPFVLVNRASGQWFELKRPFDVASGLLTGWQELKQFSRLLVVLAGALAIFYFIVLRHVGFFGWLLGLLIGVPAIFSVVTLVTHRETNRLEKDIRGGLAVAGMT